MSVAGPETFPGVYRAVVAETDDPLGRGRIRVVVPSVTLDTVSDWCWGCFTPGQPVVLPRVGQGVWVAFDAGDASAPVWLGVWGT